MYDKVQRFLSEVIRLRFISVSSLPGYWEKFSSILAFEIKPVSKFFSRWEIQYIKTLKDQSEEIVLGQKLD